MNEKLRSFSCWALFCFGLLYFWGLKSFSFHWAPSDESIYTYAAWAFLDHDALPYRDYFFAHPPLKLVWSTALFHFFGVSAALVKIMPLVASSLSYSLLFLISKREYGRLAAVTSALLFISSHTLLKSAGFWTGVHETNFLWIAALWLMQKEKLYLSGICAGLSVCTGVYGWPAILVLLFVLAMRKCPRFLQFILGFIVTVGFVHLCCTLFGGQAFWEQVYLYHLRKISGLSSAWIDHAKHFFDDFPLWVVAICAVLYFAIAAKKVSNDLAFITGTLLTLFYLVFLALINTRFNYYYCLLLPGLSLMAAYFIGKAASSLSSRSVGNTSPWLLVMVAVIGLLMWPRLYRLAFKHSVREFDVPMSWTDSQWSWANRFFKACCWQDVAKAGEFAVGPREILYRQLNWDLPVKEIATFIQKNSVPEDTIFGDSLVAGFVAILSGRSLSRDFVDTNTMRFMVMRQNVPAAIKTIDSDHLKFVLVSAKKSDENGDRWYLQHFASVPQFKKWLKKDFKLERSVLTSPTRALLLFKKLPHVADN